MNVKQLIEALSNYPANMDVFLAERKTEFAYGLLNSVRQQEIGFIEDPGDEEIMAKDIVIILDEE